MEKSADCTKNVAASVKQFHKPVECGAGRKKKGQCTEDSVGREEQIK